MKLLNLNKKGYFFMLDGMLALAVLVTGIIVIGSMFVSEPVFKPPYNIGNDLLNIMSRTSMSSLNTDVKPNIQQLFIDGKITDSNVSAINQIGKFYHECNLEDSSLLVSEIIAKVIPYPHYVEVTITGESCPFETLYTNYIPDTEIEESKSNSKLVMVTERIVFGNYDPLTLFGPYVMQIAIWR